MTDPTGCELELSRFWNAVANGAPGTAGELDAATASTVRYLHRLASAPPPVSARERVWRGLVAGEVSSRIRQEVSMTETADRLGPHQRAKLNGRHSSPPGSAPTEGVRAARRIYDRRWISLAVAMAAIVLIGSWFLVRPYLESNDAHTNLPAPEVTPVPTHDPASYNGVLIDLLLADQPLSTQYIDVEKVRFNSGYSYGGNYANGSNFVEVITQGELTVTVDGPTQVLRGFGADPEPAAAGVPQVLRAGDAIAIGPHTLFKNEHNGDLPAIIVSFNLLDPNINAPSQANDVLWQLSQANGHFAPGPIRMVVRRVTLQPGESYSRPTAGPLLIFAPEDPNSSITGYLIGDAANFGKVPEAMFVFTLEPVAGSPSTPVADFTD